MEWRLIDESITKKLAFGRGKFAGVEGFDLCVSGDGLAHIQNTLGDRTRDLLSAVTVWARVSPQQKEFVLAGLKASGHTTLMCGDGTNDVGALKQAHVGMPHHMGLAACLLRLQLTSVLHSSRYCAPNQHQQGQGVCQGRRNRNRNRNHARGRRRTRCARRR
jgi:hypothetical protein